VVKLSAEPDQAHIRADETLDDVSRLLVERFEVWVAEHRDAEGRTILERSDVERGRTLPQQVFPS
jgi:hypothetical protein